jgi:hypothetical protein
MITTGRFPSLPPKWTSVSGSSSASPLRSLIVAGASCVSTVPSARVTCAEPDTIS